MLVSALTFGLPMTVSSAPPVNKVARNAAAAPQHARAKAAAEVVHAIHALTGQPHKHARTGTVRIFGGTVRATPRMPQSESDSDS